MAYLIKSKLSNTLGNDCGHRWQDNPFGRRRRPDARVEVMPGVYLVSVARFTRKVVVR